MEQTLIAVHDVSFYKNGVSVLDNITCSFQKGQITTLIGPNGGGKTTLIKLILGIYLPTSGRIVQKKGLRIGYMPQRMSIDSFMPLTVERFLRQVKTLDDMDAGYLKSREMSGLSGGEMQRVLLAYALKDKPHVLVLDEPAQGLDVEGEKKLYDFILSYQKKSGCAIVMASHDLNFVMKKTDQVLCIQHHLCCQGRPKEAKISEAYQEILGKVPYVHHHNHHHNLDGMAIDFKNAPTLIDENVNAAPICNKKRGIK